VEQIIFYALPDTLIQNVKEFRFKNGHTNHLDAKPTMLSLVNHVRHKYTNYDAICKKSPYNDPGVDYLRAHINEQIREVLLKDVVL
jgi:hypothetical protein